MKKLILTLALTVFTLYLMAADPPFKAVQKGSFGVGVWPILNSNNTNRDSFGSDISTRNRGITLTGRYAISNVIQIEPSFGLSITKREFANTAGTVYGNSKRSGVNLGITGLATKVIIETDKRALSISPTIGINYFTGSIN
mgnify:CR=1 FL=1